MEKTMVRQAVPLQPMEVHGGADIHLQPVEDPTLEQVETPEGGCDPGRSLRWSKLLAGPVAPWRGEPTPEQIDANGEVQIMVQPMISLYLDAK
ncbi:AN1-type zinc finger protein 5-like [Grus japonensis]|uniref:AN1-type zinc finger protein 5-like n=1 Tax=Grus japonensis TaxID=30415 RepID=A0ABC9Y8F2_GRUJA